MSFSPLEEGHTATMNCYGKEVQGLISCRYIYGGKEHIRLKVFDEYFPEELKRHFLLFGTPGNHYMIFRITSKGIWLPEVNLKSYAERLKSIETVKEKPTGLLDRLFGK